MSKLDSLVNKHHIIPVSLDTKPLPCDIGCAICLKLTKRTRRFKTPKSKFYHLHKFHHEDHLVNGSPTLEDELKNLEQLSIANQRGILFK